MMRYTTIILIPIILMTSLLNAQDFDENKCTGLVEFIFLDKKNAKNGWSSHNDNQNYLNIIIQENRVLFREKGYNNVDKLSKAIKSDSKLNSNFDVVIGIDAELAYNRFTEIICMLKEEYGISTVNVYHYKID